MLITGIELIILGILAAPSLILAKKPNAQQYLDKITPYQGWIGLVLCILGIWNIISCILLLRWLGLGFWEILSWATWMAVSVLQTVLGFILGYGMIQKYALSKNEAAAKKGTELLAKLAPIQGKLGLFGIIVGLWCVVAAILFV